MDRVEVVESIAASSALNLQICLDLSVASSLHGINITAEQGLKSATSRSLVCMLVLVTTLITKIHGIHHYKYGMM